MTRFQSLVTRNPMMIEITRFRRKFLGGRGNAVNRIIFVMALLIYFGIVLLVTRYGDSTPPTALIMFQTGIFTLLCPAMLYGSIAGERERRSWDFLLVAPVTQGQIVFGKFFGAACATLGIAALFLVPIAISAISYTPYDYYNYTSYNDYSDAWPNGPTSVFSTVVQSELVSLSWAMLVCGITLLFSARSKRGFIALGTTLALLAGGIIVWPILMMASGLDRGSSDLFNYLHPFWALERISAFGRPYRSSELSADWFFGLPQTFVYLGLTIVTLVWAEQTLRFADNQVRFVTKKKDA